MARRDDYEHWGMGLPGASDALKDVDALCEELGLQRAEVCRLIVITWSKARRGKVQELWGFTPGVVFAPHANGHSDTPGHSVAPAAPTTATRHKKMVSDTTAAAVQGLNLDLD